MTEVKAKRKNQEQQKHGKSGTALTEGIGTGNPFYAVKRQFDRLKDDQII